MVADELAQLRHERRVAPKAQIGLDPTLEHREALLVEARRDRPDGLLAVEIRKRRAAPERKRLREPRRRLLEPTVQ